MQEAGIYMTERGMLAYNTAKHLLEKGGTVEELKRVRGELIQEIIRLRRRGRDRHEGVRLLAVMLGNVERSLRER